MMQFALIVLVILLLVIVIGYAIAIAIGHPLIEKPQMIAHRGGAAYQPENTMAAFRQAAADGADWLEFDVQMTKDGALVVIHDTTVDRTTNGSGPLADFTLAELRALDAGNGEHVPTLDEVLELAKQAGRGVFVELKSPQLYPGIEEKLADVLAKAGYEDRAIVQSFVPQALARVRALNPDLRLCLLTGIDTFSPQVGPADALCPMAEMALLFPFLLHRAHVHGHRAYVWFGVVEHPLTMRLLLALGADGLIVDDHRALLQILGPNPVSHN